MATIDLESLFKEVSPEAPCGENLAYDAQFLAMEQAAQPKPERGFGDTVIEAEEPNWKDVHAKALRLLERTRDLRVAGYLTRSLLHTEGLPGFSGGLALIRSYLERYWEDVHPRLDPDDGNDPTERLNVLVSLADPGTTLRGLKRAPLVVSATAGAFSLRDILVARGQLPPSAGESPVDIKLIDSAFATCEIESLQGTLAVVKDALDSLSAIETLLAGRVNAAQIPDTSALPEALVACRTILAEHLDRRGVRDESLSPADSAGGAARVETYGEIRTRDDAARALDAVISYFDRQEPSSPVPLLLRRAKRLISKSFLEIIRDLAPEGVRQAEGFRGPVDTDS